MMTFCCTESNDLYALLARNGARHPRFDTPAEAVRNAPPGSAVLILADGYPDARTRLEPSTWEVVQRNRLRTFVEYPDSAPDIALGEVHQTTWERLVVMSDAFGDELKPGSLLSISACRYIEATAAHPWLVSARVAGFDEAVFGVPEGAAPLLFEIPNASVLLATTCLSRFITARYAPAGSWKAVWQAILRWLEPTEPPSVPDWTPHVRPSYSSSESLPPDAELRSLRRAGEWVHASGLLLGEERREYVYEMLRSGLETAPASPECVGDGSHGILEGYASAIEHDGTQLQRLPVRADCQAETAMVLAMDDACNNVPLSKRAARNLLDFLYFRSPLHGGARGNPEHPAYGLIAWGAASPAWEVANYGDDNARAILASMLAGSCLKSGTWTEPVLRAIVANLRTTGRLGFRGNRIDMPDLERNGWRFYADAETVNPAPHYEAYLWACYLRAYDLTGFHPFLEAAKSGIRHTMNVFPNGWLFNDTSERGQMLLPLAWLVRLEDTNEHRGWLRTIADELISIQAPCGALPERFHSEDAGYYRIPRSNEDYGVTETPLIQRNGDPASDQLYTSGFALLGLHEAACVSADGALLAAENRLASYLCRIQSLSDRFPYLNGAWFRAFDFQRWDYWSSSADAGWGAWCVEAGWGAAWTAAVLGLRHLETSLWEHTSGVQLGSVLSKVRDEMSRSDGGPWLA